MSDRAGARGAKVAPPAWTVILSEFWAGLSGQSRTATGMLMLGFSISLACLLWLFSPATLAGPLGAYLPQNQIDSHAFVTVDALRMARTPQTRPRILMLGASTIEQPFGDGQAFQRAISARTGEDWEVHVLAAASQSPLEQMSILETVLSGRDAQDPPVVVTLTAGLWRATWTRERMLGPESRGRLGLRSDRADEEMRYLGGVPGPRTGFYVIDNFRFIVTEAIPMLRHLALASPFERKFSPHAESLPRTGQARVKTDMRDTITAALLRTDAYVAQLERMIDWLQDLPAVRVIVFEDLVSPDVPELLGIVDPVRELDRRIEASAASRGVPVWRIGPEAGLGPDDYNDDVHTKIGEPQAKVVAATTERFDAFLRSVPPPERTGTRPGPRRLP